MPTISVFYGILIQMHWDEHGPPHFHAVYGEYTAQVDWRKLRIIHGWLPPRVWKLVRRWASTRQAELEENWNRCVALEPPEPISPLP
jgi:hypothetical protein